jgi:hypothetical protein
MIMEGGKTSSSHTCAWSLGILTSTPDYKVIPIIHTGEKAGGSEESAIYEVVTYKNLRFPIEMTVDMYRYGGKEWEMDKDDVEQKIFEEEKYLVRLQTYLDKFYPLTSYGDIDIGKICEIIVGLSREYRHGVHEKTIHSDKVKIYNADKGRGFSYKVL